MHHLTICPEISVEQSSYRSKIENIKLFHCGIMIPVPTFSSDMIFLSGIYCTFYWSRGFQQLSLPQDLSWSHLAEKKNQYNFNTNIEASVALALIDTGRTFKHSTGLPTDSCWVLWKAQYNQSGWTHQSLVTLGWICGYTQNMDRNTSFISYIFCLLRHSSFWWQDTKLWPWVMQKCRGPLQHPSHMVWQVWQSKATLTSLCSITMVMVW